MIRYRPLRRVGRFWLVLLMLSVVANGTQAVVLCAGCDGHLAVEMAGHHHCHNKNDCQHDSNDHADEHGTPCRLCVDIPLSTAISGGPSVQKAPATIALFAGIALSIPDRADHGLETCAAAGASLSFTSFYDPLSSIILIV